LGDAHDAARTLQPWGLGSQTSLMARRAKVSFIEPMLLLRRHALPDDGVG